MPEPTACAPSASWKMAASTRNDTAKSTTGAFLGSLEVEEGADQQMRRKQHQERGERP